MSITNQKKSLILKLLLSCLFVFCAFIFLCYFYGDVPRTSGEIPCEAYIWQRNWNTEVTDAITLASSEMSCFAALCAEVSLRQNQVDDVVFVPINYEALKSTRKPVALAFRIGPFSGDFRKNPETTELFCNIACSLIQQSRENGIEPAELHIDFDCAESKLDSYRELVRVLKENIRKLSDTFNKEQPTPVIITALPCWLKHREFKLLARESDGFVLQVHSLEIPKNPDAPIVLCNTASSLKWVEKAAKLDVPFRVALPTYGCIVGFDNEGKFLGITTEGPARDWPEDSVHRLVYSDAKAIAELINKWQISRPENMLGIIWYRLPVETDRFNWKWETLEMVMNGQKPKEEVQVVINYSQAGLAKISLVNTGKLDYLPKNTINVQSDYSDIIAAEGMNGFVFDSGDPADVNFKLANQNTLIRIRPGEQLLIGWLRFSENAKVDAHVDKIY